LTDGCDQLATRILAANKKKIKIHTVVRTKPEDRLNSIYVAVCTVCYLPVMNGLYALYVTDEWFVWNDHIPTHM
jgi:hypothetical protein